MARKKAEAPATEPEATVAAQGTAQEGQDATQATENTTPPPEATEGQETPQEANLDPDQLREMDDDNLRRLAQDMGLDPDAYQDRDALIAAIVEVPVIPGPAEPEPEPEPVTPDTPTPFEATVAAHLAVLRRTIGPGTAQQQKPVATLKHGTKVIIRAVVGDFAQLDNGLWTKAAYLVK